MNNPFIKEIIGEIEDDKNVTILVTGETGVGKSSLINGLIGMVVAKTGSDVAGVTKATNIITMTKKGIAINIIDTPGFNDRFLKDEDTLQNAHQKGGQIDLLLFCLKIKGRFMKHHVVEMKTITDVLGEDIWKKAVFVLTFANKFNDSTEEENVKELQTKLNEWERELKMSMKEIINHEIAEKIPIVPTGHKEPQLPGRPSWISEFWIQGFRRMSFKSMLKLVLINEERIHNSMHDLKLSQDMYGNPEDQPLFLCHMSKEEKWISPEDYLHIKNIIVVVGLGAGMFIPSARPFVDLGVIGVSIIGSLITYLNTADENPNENPNDCVDDAITKSLIIAFMEEYPEYKYIYEPLKDEL